MNDDWEILSCQSRLSLSNNIIGLLKLICLVPPRSPPMCWIPEKQLRNNIILTSPAVSTELLVSEFEEFFRWEVDLHKTPCWLYIFLTYFLGAVSTK